MRAPLLFEISEEHLNVLTHELEMDDGGRRLDGLNIFKTDTGSFEPELKLVIGRFFLGACETLQIFSNRCRIGVNEESHRFFFTKKKLF